MIQIFEKDKLIHISIENDLVRAVILPEIGGKMIEFKNKKTGTQFLLEPQNESGRYEQASFGDEFDKYDTSGFDECFPTLETSEYSSLNNSKKNYDIILPDHGELWSRAWKYQIIDDEIRLSIDGVKFDYHFEKKISVQKNRLIIDYLLKNQSSGNFSYLWAAHPLLKVTPGSEIILPVNGKDQMFLNWASDEKIGKFGDHLKWPYLSQVDQKINYAEVQPQSLGQAVKFFTNPVEHGYAGYYDTKLDEALFFEFDPQENPYVGIWLCYGGWPVDAARKHFTVAIEPGNGRPDSLKEAVLRGECSEVEAGGEKKWTLQISLWKGKPEIPLRR